MRHTHTHTHTHTHAHAHARVRVHARTHTHHIDTPERTARQSANHTATPLRGMDVCNGSPQRDCTAWRSAVHALGEGKSSRLVQSAQRFMAKRVWWYTRGRINLRATVTVSVALSEVVMRYTVLPAASR